MTDEQIERIARRLFPDDIHDGHDCRAEIGRGGQPCRICANLAERWTARIESVRAAVEAEATAAA